MFPIYLPMLGFLLAFSQSALADDVVITHGDTKVTVDDLRRSIEQGIPRSKRARFFADRQRLSQHAGSYFVIRKLAEEARERELSEDEQWRLQEATNRALSQIQLDYLVTNARQPDFEQLAREAYLAHPDRYQQEESIRVRHILVSTRERPRDEAHARAEEVASLARQADADFEALAMEYSDDPSLTENRGDLGFFSRGRMVKQFEDAAFALNEVGDIAGPVESPFGFHVIRLLDRKEPVVRPFDEVKADIVDQQRTKFRDLVVNEEIARIGSLDGAEVDYEALMTLYQPLPVSSDSAVSSDSD